MVGPIIGGAVPQGRRAAAATSGQRTRSGSKENDVRKFIVERERPMPST